MYAQIHSSARPSFSSAARPTRAILQTRPRIQRALIRSWEYSRPVRISILIVRLLVVLWLVFLGVVMMSVGYPWGVTLLAAAAAVLAVSTWVFTTAERGWPARRA